MFEVCLASPQAKITKINNERETVAYSQPLGKSHFSSATKLLKNCDTEFLIFCCECALNAVNGTVGIKMKELRPYEKQLRLLCRKSTIKKRKKF